MRPRTPVTQAWGSKPFRTADANLTTKGMVDQLSGKRKGAGQKQGSKNKVTVAREAIAEVLDVPDPMNLAVAIHQRGYKIWY